MRNVERQTEWARRLRDPLTPKQGKSLLHYIDADGVERMCCLGVASQYAAQNGVCEVTEEEAPFEFDYVDANGDKQHPRKVYAYNGAAALPPHSVAAWMGWVAEDDGGYIDEDFDPELTGTVIYSGSVKPVLDERGEPVEYGASQWNDEYNATFNQIADMVEARARES